MSKKGLIAGGLLSLLVVSSSVYAAESGVYLGVSGGQATVDIDKEDLDDLVEFTFFAAGAPVLTGTSSLEDSDTSYSVFFGYRFNRSFALEASYIKLATADYVSSGTVNPPGPVASTPAGYTAKFESSGFTVAAVGGIPIGDSFDIHARVGLYFADTEIEELATYSTARLTDTLSATTQEVLYGLGFGFMLGENWSLALDYTIYSDVGDEEETGEASVENISASIAFHF